MPAPTTPAPAAPAMTWQQANDALIDAGFPPDQVQAMLKAIGLTPDEPATFSEGYRGGTVLSARGRKALAAIRDVAPRVAAKYGVR